MQKLTETQIAVVNSRVKQGYSVLGYYNSLTTQGITVGIVKGKHRMQVNCLGFCEYTGNPVAYKEIHE